MNIHTFNSPKGGTGCTTFASSTALLLAESGAPTLLVDAGINHDTYGWLAMVTPHDCKVIENAIDNLDVVSVDSLDEYLALDFNNYTHVVVDAGQSKIEIPFSDDDDIKRTLVVRNDYLSLRNSVSNGALQYDMALVILEPNRALNLRDCQTVLGIETVAVEYSIDWARSIDAGLTAYRVSRFMGDVLAPVMA